MGWFPDLASDGRHTRLRQAVQACCHGQLIERCSIRRRAEVAMLAGTAMRVWWDREADRAGQGRDRRDQR
jgi:hypothetical protein